MQRPTTGAAGLLHETGVAQTALDPEGQVLVHGELWTAVATRAGHPRGRARPRRRRRGAQAPGGARVRPAGLTLPGGRMETAFYVVPVLILGALHPVVVGQDPARVRAGGRLPAGAPRPEQGPAARRHPADPLRRQDGEGEPAHGRHGRRPPGRHHAGQRVDQGQRRDLLPRHRPAPGGRPGGGLPLRDVPDRADDAPERPRARSSWTTSSPRASRSTSSSSGSSTSTPIPGA